MYINFLQNRANRSVITVHTNVFAKNHKLHKFATTNRIFSKIDISNMHHRKTYMYNNFQQNRVSRPVKTVHTNLFAKVCKMTPFGHALPLADVQAYFEINRPVRYRNTAKISYFPQTTDGQTDGRTDVAYDKNRYFFFQKRKTTKKQQALFSS